MNIAVTSLISKLQGVSVLHERSVKICGQKFREIGTELNILLRNELENYFMKMVLIAKLINTFRWKYLEFTLAFFSDKNFVKTTCSFKGSYF